MSEGTAPQQSPDTPGDATGQPSPQEIYICTEMQLPLEQEEEAERIAIAENPENGVRSKDRLAALIAKKWQKGRTLRVRFMGGTQAMHTKVASYAQQWSQFANIKFLFNNHAQAEIRIAFAPGGSWSYLGTDALLIPNNQATMNYGWLTPTSADSEYSRVVIHEFGHALGCIHEHQHPTAAIPWDKPAVYRYYMGPPNNWTRAQVDSNIFQKYSTGITQFSAFDTKSIMLYAIPNSLTIGNYEVGWNQVLSPTDKNFIKQIYPA